jgi:hypothetical protein
MSAERSGLRDRLESVGDPRHIRWRERQTDYVKLCEVTGADVEELVAVAQEWADPQDDWPEDDENYVAGYAPLHAWRCLAHLEAPEAVEPLLAIIDTLDEQGDDWFLEDLPYVFAFVGPPAIDPLCAYLADDRHGTYSRICAGRGMELAAKRHPSTRARVIEGVGDVLGGFREHDPALNAFLCGALLERWPSLTAVIQAVEAAKIPRGGRTTGYPTVAAGLPLNRFLHPRMLPAHDHQTMDVLHGGAGGVDEPPAAGSDSLPQGREPDPPGEARPKTHPPEHLAEATAGGRRCAPASQVPG